MPNLRTPHLASLLLLAATIGFTLGACAHSEHRIKKVCAHFCDRAYDCDDNTNRDKCFDDCVDSAHECSSDDDVEAALDILDDCVADSCNQVAGCTIDAWLECNF
jgi:hypothetical protein